MNPLSISSSTSRADGAVPDSAADHRARLAAQAFTTQAAGARPGGGPRGTVRALPITVGAAPLNEA